jgi:hypothetical protein
MACMPNIEAVIRLKSRYDILRIIVARNDCIGIELDYNQETVNASPKWVIFPSDSYAKQNNDKENQCKTAGQWAAASHSSY